MSLFSEVIGGEQAQAQEPRNVQDQQLKVQQFLADQRAKQQALQMNNMNMQQQQRQNQQQDMATAAQKAGMADYLGVIKNQMGGGAPSAGGPNVGPTGIPQQPQMATLSFDTVAQSLLKSKPGIAPDEFISAMKQFEPQFAMADKMKLAQAQAQMKQQNMTVDEQVYKSAIQNGMDPQQAAQQVSKAKAAGAGQVEEAKKSADAKEKMIAAQPKAEAQMKSFIENESDADSTIDEALGQSNAWTTGFTGGVLKHVLGSDAYNLDMNLKKLQSRLGLDTLSELKNNSPNGSALGRVTNYEMGILVNAKANLEQAQSQKQFEAALKDLKVKIANSKKHVKEAYDETYGEVDNKEQKQETPPASKTVDFNDWK